MDAYRNAPLVHGRTTHLTKLYSDVKQSAVKQSAVTTLDVKSFLSQQAATEQFSALHRKFRIQKDRLVTWGLEWDDEGKGAETNIDETVERAGLTETVTSVLANVKEVTDELEKVRSGVSKPGEKYQPSIFDEERYGDLLSDLTASIDTLYDLSRTRRALVRGEHPMLSNTTQQQATQSTPMSKRQSKAPSFADSDITSAPAAPRAVYSPYVGLPPIIDPSALRMPAESPPPYEPPGVPMASRLIANLIRARAPEEVRNAMGSDNAEVPVLVEYADFDPAYRQTGVPPPLQRIEDLSRTFPPMRPESQSNLSLLGYFEDPRQPRVGLVYDLPYSVQNRLLSNPARRTENMAPLSLLRLLRKQDRTTANAGQSDAPPLEARFKLALRLAEQLYMLHLQELPHGNINSSSVLFATANNESTFTRMKQLRAPMWASFNIFPHSLGGPVRAPHNIYKHPQEGENSAGDGLKYDMYAFALLLVEIGLWAPLGDFYKPKYSAADFKLRIEKLWIPKLAERCGSAYMRAVQACIRNVDSGELTTEGMFGYIFDNLRKCCALDEDTEDLTPSSPFTSPQQEYQSFVPSNVAVTAPVFTRHVEAPLARGAELDPNLLSPTLSMKDFKRRVTQIQRQWRKYRSWLREIQTIPDDEAIARKLSEMENADVAEAVPAPAPASAQPKTNLSEFPFLEIPKAIVEDWNNGTAVELSRIVNRALKGTRESCSITLTSFGETLETARPTYLVTCASTKIVKAMLKRHFRCDPASCYVRVEKGKVTRCRKARPISAARAATRSMAPRYDLDSDAVNSDYQPQPMCGASIGAYKDEEHLPPVSFGGVVVIDGKSYGMSVHHMLEADEDEEEDDIDEDDEEGSDTASLVDVGENAELLLSDDGSTIRELSVASDISLDEETQFAGDVGGIAPGEGLDIDITQPALDDAIAQNLHAEQSDSESGSDSGVDEDHILSYKLGQVHASSGLKRSATKGTEEGYKGISSSLPQEIDWALFELLPPRVQPYNIVKGGQQYCDGPADGQDSIPTSIRGSSQLAGAKVHCLGRTSGLSSGTVSSAMELLRLQGRTTFSASWAVHGGFGVGGDSGAWVIDSENLVVGHVLAERNGRTFICPMDLLFDDMRSTLGAKNISLPIPSKNTEGGWFIQDTVADAVSRLRLNDNDGGVAVPYSPAASQHGGELAHNMAPLQSAR
ncbi:hypothetical protein AMS68_000299 [Peltaster fructicola]|uniref:Protein kinase domain-containing protein n=1 Tax=Peltaster fructicola TaxID=286661 RepID=A0A6H0XJ89_9PEZI|nr:hypothetical protein AMS68_000299 [Peltaster fructicola]